jgi:hypothetical protein
MLVKKLRPDISGNRGRFMDASLGLTMKKNSKEKIRQVTRQARDCSAKTSTDIV